MALTVYRGNNKTFRLTVRDDSGSAMDTTGWTIDFAVRVSEGAGSTVITKTSGTPGEIDAVDAGSGVWDIKLIPADTSALTPGAHVYGIRATTDGGMVYTIQKGRIEIVQEIV